MTKIFQNAEFAVSGNNKQAAFSHLTSCGIYFILSVSEALMLMVRTFCCSGCSPFDEITTVQLGMLRAGHFSKHLSLNITFFVCVSHECKVYFFSYSKSLFIFSLFDRLFQLSHRAHCL